VFASAEREDHGLVVFLQLVVNFGEDESGKFAVGEGFIFMECFSVDSQRLAHGNILSVKNVALEQSMPQR
jgi:hypothetical protein